MEDYQRRWANATRRKLPSGWVIHHLNGDHNDNRPENLVALPKAMHDWLHSARFERLKHSNRYERFKEILRRLDEIVQELESDVSELVSDLAKEQRRGRTKSAKGKVRAHGYKSKKTGSYKWVTTTLDELESSTHYVDRLIAALSYVKLRYLESLIQQRSLVG